MVPDPECRVQGLVWDLTADCEAALDAYEGVSHGTYTKEVMAVGGGEALVDPAANTRPGRPRPGYLERILGGAAVLDFPPAYRAELAAWQPAERAHIRFADPQLRSSRTSSP